jgi:hypothetical protein
MEHSIFIRTAPIKICVASAATALLLYTVPSGVSAAPLPGVVSTPVGAGLQSVGGVASAAGQGHAGIAPTVYGAAPALEPATDSVTNALTGVGAGLTASGQGVQSGGLAVSPIAGARTAVQSLRNGTLVQARVGGVGLGRGSPTTVIGVGALSASPPQGTLATAGVANANALLNANVAPQ